MNSCGWRYVYIFILCISQCDVKTTAENILNCTSPRLWRVHSRVNPSRIPVPSCTVSVATCNLNCQEVPLNTCVWFMLWPSWKIAGYKQTLFEMGNLVSERWALSLWSHLFSNCIIVFTSKITVKLVGKFVFKGIHLEKPDCTDPAAVTFPPGDWCGKNNRTQFPLLYYLSSCIYCSDF